MKLHLLSALRTSLLVCLGCLAAVPATLPTAVLGGGLFLSALAGQAGAETVNITANTTWSNSDIKTWTDNGSKAGQTTNIPKKDNNANLRLTIGNVEDSGIGNYTGTASLGTIVVEGGDSSMTSYVENNTTEALLRLALTKAADKDDSTDDKVNIDAAITLKNHARIYAAEGSYYFSKTVKVEGAACISTKTANGYVFDDLQGTNAHLTLTRNSTSGSGFGGNESVLYAINGSDSSGFTGRIILKALDDRPIYLLINGSEQTNSLTGAIIDTGSEAATITRYLALNTGDVYIKGLSGKGEVVLAKNCTIENSGKITDASTAAQSSTLHLMEGTTETFFGTVGAGVTMAVDSGTHSFDGVTWNEESGLTIGDGGTAVLIGRQTLGGSLTINTGGTLLISENGTILDLSGIASTGDCNLGGNLAFGTGTKIQLAAEEEYSTDMGFTVGILKEASDAGNMTDIADGTNISGYIHGLVGRQQATYNKVDASSSTISISEKNYSLTWIGSEEAHTWVDGSTSWTVENGEDIDTIKGFQEHDSVRFGSSGYETVTLQGHLVANDLSIADKGYQFEVTDSSEASLSFKEITISNGGSFTKTGGGTLSMSAANAQEAAVNIAAGTLLISELLETATDLSAVSSTAGGTLALSTSGTESAGTQLTLGKDFVGTLRVDGGYLAASETLGKAVVQLGEGAGLVISGAIAMEKALTGTGVLVKTGTGEATLADVSGFTGSIKLGGGTLTLGNAGSISSVTGSEASTLKFTDGSVVTIGNVNSPATSWNPTYGGRDFGGNYDTTINTGANSVITDYQHWSVRNNKLNIEGGGVYKVQGITLARSSGSTSILNVKGGTILKIMGTTQTSDDNTAQTGSLNIGRWVSTTSTVNIEAGSKLIVDTGFSTTQGTGNVNVSGVLAMTAGMSLVSGNGGSAEVNVQKGGVLMLGNKTGSAGSDGLTVNLEDGATLAAWGYNESDEYAGNGKASVTVAAGTFSITSDASVTFQAYDDKTTDAVEQSLTVDVSVAGAGGITAQGGGSITLNDTEGFSGAVTINEGTSLTLGLGGTSALSLSTLNIATGGTLGLRDGSSSRATLSVAGNKTIATLTDAEVYDGGLRKQADAAVATLKGAKLTINSSYVVSGITLDDSEITFGSTDMNAVIEFADLVIKENSMLTGTGNTIATLTGNTTLDFAAAVQPEATLLALADDGIVQQAEVVQNYSSAQLNGVMLGSDATLTLNTTQPLDTTQDASFTFTGLTGLTESNLVLGNAFSGYSGNYTVTASGADTILSFTGTGVTPTPSGAIPEPATATLSLLAFAACAARRRRQGR